MSPSNRNRYRNHDRLRKRALQKLWLLEKRPPLQFGMLGSGLKPISMAIAILIFESTLKPEEA